MGNQNKLSRMLQILLYLSGNYGHSRKEIAERFGINERTVYRYLSTFKEAGLVLEEKDGFYRVNKEEGEGKTIADLLHFSEEEAWILSKAIHSVEDNNIMKQNLVKKLYALYDFDRVAESIIKKEQSENVHEIINAIKEKKQLLLRSYKSANSSVIRDRLVEPIKFTTNYISFWAFDPESGENKLFKTSRIGRAVIYNKDWQHENFHDPGNMDVFRVSGTEELPVTLRLTLRACSLLCEEFPLAEKHITTIHENEYIFETMVHGFEGVGRFVLGLMDEIEVEETTDFKRFLNGKLMKRKF